MFSAKIDQHDDLKDKSNKEFPSTSSLILRFFIFNYHFWLKAWKWSKVTQVSEKGGS
jgi:hypothetical protein